jgi:hypothetical protein
MRIAPTAVALAMAFPGSAALGQTAADREACTGDVLRLCSSALPHRGRVIACIVRNKGQLGSECRAVVARYSAKYGRGSQRAEKTADGATASLQPVRAGHAE